MVFGPCFVVDQTYHNDRIQFIQFGSHRSYCRILCGVPQGFFLGHLLFITTFAVDRDNDHLISIAINFKNSYFSLKRISYL